MSRLFRLAFRRGPSWHVDASGARADVARRRVGAMFQLAKLEDTVHIQPSQFGRPILDAVTDELNAKYPNKARCHCHHRQPCEHTRDHASSSRRCCSRSACASRYTTCSASATLSSTRARRASIHSLSSESSCSGAHPTRCCGAVPRACHREHRQAARYTPAVTLRPFEGEILTGTVLSCDRLGARLSIGFFDDIHVPSAMLQVRISAVSRLIT